MAEFTGITAARADEILDQSVISGAVNGSGHLILTRHDGSTIDAGDFTAIVSGILTQQVNDAIATALPNAVAGTVVDRGNISGALSFSGFNNANLVNAMIKATLVGNLTVDVNSLPSAPKANTQFVLRLKQDATGGRTITLTGFKKSQGVLSLTPTANAIDMLVFVYDGASWYAGLMGADFR